MMFSGATPFFHYWVAGRPIPGESESGDQYVVTTFDGGALVAVIDGLGHGPKAADAAKLAAATLVTHAYEPVVTLVKRCHEELRRSRGVVMSLASFHDATGTLTWLGIGNVEGMLLNANVAGNGRRASLVPRGGIVGERMPTQFYPITLAVHHGDLLVFATDGIGSMFTQDVRHLEQPRQLIHHIFHQHAKKTDDALILGAQWTNGDGNPASRENPEPKSEPGTSR